MSHISKTTTQLKDLNILKKTAEVLGLKWEMVKDYKFYDGTIASGFAVYLKDWDYPVVITEEGEIFYDNYEGNWGDIAELEAFQQQYSIESVKSVAKKKGMKVTEKRLEDGRVQLITT